MADKNRVVLVCATGMSPAVITETVWALAHESPAVIVDEVVAVTTLDGAAAIREQLLYSGVWERLREALRKEGLEVAGKLRFGASDSIRVIGDGESDCHDIATPEENQKTGDFILRVLRQFTENPENIVIASIAGGRKTMSALMLACMTLLGRDQDRVCHVLVNPPYDSFDLVPRFYFPGLAESHCLGVENYPADAAQISLADVPFVRFRKRRLLPEDVPSYTELVARTQRDIDSSDLPSVILDMIAGRVCVGGKMCDLNGMELAVMYGLLKCRLTGKRLDGWHVLEPVLRAVHTHRPVSPQAIVWHDYQSGKLPDIKEDVRKIVSRLRRRLLDAGIDEVIVRRLVPNLRQHLNPYPLEKIEIRGPDGL